MSDDNKDKLRASINAIESCYEFMLAFAAQGWHAEPTGGGGGPSIREYLGNMQDGLKTIGDDFEAVIADEVGENVEFYSDYVTVLRQDAEKTLKAVSLVLSLPNIGSQIIDNLNASIHIRALLTDIFLLDEAILTLSKVYD